jgi:hypothetical protein
VYLYPLGWLGNGLVLAGGTALAVAVGLAAAGPLGRRFAGGMLMSPLVRVVFLAALLAGAAGAVGVGFLRGGEQPQPAAAPAAAERRSG